MMYILMLLHNLILFLSEIREFLGTQWSHSCSILHAFQDVRYLDRLPSQD